MKGRRVGLRSRLSPARPRGVSVAAARRMLSWARNSQHLVPELPKPWDVDSFVERVAERREREIKITAVSAREGLNEAAAFWYEYPEYDEIRLNSQNVAGIDRDNNIIHEAAHMLAGHRGVPVSKCEDLASDSSVTVVVDEECLPTRVLHRGYYGSFRELQAETLAFTIWEAAGFRLFPDGDNDTARLVGAFEQCHEREGPRR